MNKYIYCVRSNTIKSLDIIDKNLSQANVETMISAFTRLESLSLHYGTLIGARTMETLFREMTSTTSRLRRLSLRNISLSHVEPAVLGAGVRNLQSLEIMISDLDPAQLHHIFSTFSSRHNTSLDHLCLSQNDLSQLSPQLFIQVCKNCKVQSDS